MADPIQSEATTEQLVMTDEMREALRGAHVTDEEAFTKGQQQVEDMIAANEPLGDILSTLVKMIEAQSPGMF